MIETVSVSSFSQISGYCGASLGTQIMEKFAGQSPDVIVVFASAQFNFSDLLVALERTTQAKIIVGGSSAGEFATGFHGTASASALAIRTDEMIFSASVAHGLRTSYSFAAHEICSRLRSHEFPDFEHRTMFLMADALAGETDELVEALTSLTQGKYQFFGGGAGDDGQFLKTFVFLGVEALTDATVALEILSKKPIGIGAQHGWEPASSPLEVTESKGGRVYCLDHKPACDVFQEYAHKTEQRFNLFDPSPFLLHNVLGIKTTAGFKLRVPLAIESDGSIIFASDVPRGSQVCMMRTTAESTVQAAIKAVELALERIGNLKPKAALFFDCVATRLRMGNQFEAELLSVQEKLGMFATYAGCNSYGQIVRVDGQFNGFHNCTAVVAVFPE